MALAVAADASHQPERYMELFPGLMTEQIPFIYDEIQARIRRPKEPTD